MKLLVKNIGTLAGLNTESLKLPMASLRASAQEMKPQVQFAAMPSQHLEQRIARQREPWLSMLREVP